MQPLHQDLRPKTQHPGGYSAYLFDADGTLVYPDAAVAGAPEAVAALKRAGRRIAVVTNNSFMARAELHAKLARLGFSVDEADVFTAPRAAAAYIASRRPGAVVHALGSAGLRQELRAAGLRVVSGERAEFLVAGNDLKLTYRKLLRATRALMGGARFVAINRDGLIASPEGFLPGAGMVVGALEAATGRGPEVVIGKPGPGILQQAAVWVGSPPGECLYVGDNLPSDVGAARAAEMPSLLVFTGVSSPDDLADSPIRPDYTLGSVAELAGLVK